MPDSNKVLSSRALASLAIIETREATTTLQEHAPTIMQQLVPRSRIVIVRSRRWLYIVVCRLHRVLTPFEPASLIHLGGMNVTMSPHHNQMKQP